jgi:hypothetical protein
MNSGTTLLRFGGTTKTDANQNVYRSLQFRTGKYKLCFQSQGEEGKTVTVKLQKTGKSTYVLNATVNVGAAVELPFEVTDGWGEYKLTMTRPKSTDAITVTDIVVRSLTAEEVVGIKEVRGEKPEVRGRYYDLQGRRLTAAPSRPGLYIVNGQKTLIR